MDRARTYFICGGVPLYLRYFREDRSVETNIAEQFFSPYAPLYQEPDFLLREELRELEHYYAALLAVAMGATSNAEISRHTGIDSRALTYYFRQLMELGYLARRYRCCGVEG